MKRIVVLMFISFCGSIQYGFAQSPEPVPTRKDPLQDSVEKYEKANQYEKVVLFAEEWAEKLKKNNKDNSPEYGAALNSQGDAFARTGKFIEAEPILISAVEVRKKTLGEVHTDVANTMNNLGTLYARWGQYQKAEPFFLRALEIWKKTLGETDKKVAGSSSNIATLYHSIGDFQKSERYFLQAIDIHKKRGDENKPFTAISLNNLGLLYTDWGRFSQAETYLLQALAIRQKTLSETDPNIAGSLNNLGKLYWNLGQYPKAEPLHLRALEIRKKTLGEFHPEVAHSLANLGILYWSMGQYPKSETYYLQALEINTKVFGSTNPDVAFSMGNLAILYRDMGQNAKAEMFFLQSIELLKKTLGENHQTVAQGQHNLGAMYINNGNYFKAQSLFLPALENRRKTLSEYHPFVATNLTSLGGLYKETGNYAKAELYYLKALEVYRKSLGETHPEFIACLASMGGMYCASGQMEKAETRFLEWEKKSHAQIQRYFPFLSDKEKETYYETQLSLNEDLFRSIYMERYAVNKPISIHLYNNQLETKGLLLSSSAKWKHRIRTSGDKKLFALFTEWEISQNQLNKLIQSTDSTERAGIDSVEKKTQKMEKELSLRSENFAKLADKKPVTWKEVQKTLKSGEAAIEMVRIKKFGIEKTVTDTSDPKNPTYKVKGLTDTIYYAALIVKPESIIPEMVLLKNGNELEGKYVKFYQNSISKKIPDNQSYGKFWEKIGAKLGTSTRVYFSPDGVFHNINLNTLFNPKTKKFLVEELDISLVTGTKDLLNPESSDSHGMVAEMVGFPSYYNSNATVSIATEYRSSPKLSYKLRMNSDEVLAELPATKIETEKISLILQTKGWEVKEYTGDKALEETIKESNSPKVLHIATHGYFQPDTTTGSNPLLRSGLMLAGAGSTLKGERKEGEEDGILTAYEAMNLNLDNTELVVLSACETGLGEIKNGEGVYGLQRAFKVAGAKTLIMSLWKVNDEATQELMVRFYQHWLGKGAVGTAGQTAVVMTKRSAFLKAQKELKAKYPDPYYWGAFVMVGE